MPASADIVQRPSRERATAQLHQYTAMLCAMITTATPAASVT